MAAPKEAKSWRAGLSILSVGFVMAACVALGVLFGIYLDGKLGTKPWMTAGGVVLGSVAGFIHFFRATLKSGNE